MTAMHSQTPTPPVAPHNEHREVRHGATVIDLTSGCARSRIPRSTKYLEAENAYTAAMTARPEALQRRPLQGDAGAHQADRSLRAHPPRRYFYYSRTEEGKQYPIQCRRKGSMEAPEEVLLDLNELGKDQKFVGLGGFVVSDDQNLLAYTIDFTGFRQYAPAGERSAQRADPLRHHRPRHLHGLGRRQQDALPDHRGRRHQAQRQALAPRPGLAPSSSCSTTRRTSSTTSRSARPATASIWFSQIEAKDTTEARYLSAARPPGRFRRLPAAREEAPLLHRPPRRHVLHPHQPETASISPS